MGTKEIMGWDTVKKRWHKNAYLPGNKRKMVAVSAKQLSKRYPDLVIAMTKDGTREAANLWWEEKEKELHHGPSADYARAIEILQTRIKIAEQSGELSYASALRDDLETLEVESRKPNPQRLPEHCLKDNPYSDTVNQAVYDDRLKRLLSASPTVPASNNIRGFVDAWLRNQRARVNAGDLASDRYEASRVHVTKLAEWVGENHPITMVDAPKWQEFYTWLTEQIGDNRNWRSSGKKGPRKGFAPKYARDIFNSSRLLIEWAAEMGYTSMPANLRSRKLVFKIPALRIETFTVQEIQNLVNGCGKSVETGERTKLYLLLMLNCGMYQSDISDLVWSEFDAKKGTITRKRSKTGQHENCPEVTWYLWPETLRLLKKYANRDKNILHPGKTAATGENETRLLVTAKKGPLVSKGLNGEDFAKCDNIKSAYVRLTKRLGVQARPMMLIRKTSASLLGRHPQFKFFAQYFLAQAPETIADAGYVKPSDAEFKSACEWLGTQYVISLT
jgi:integrase